MGPPEPKQAAFPESLNESLRDNPIATLTGISKECGDIAHFKLEGTDFYFLTGPELIRQLLVVGHRKVEKPPAQSQPMRHLDGNGVLWSEGEFHHRQKRLIQPAFHYERIADFAKTMAEFSVETTEKWKEGVEIDVSDEMVRLTLRILAKVLFSIELGRGSRDEELIKALYRVHKIEEREVADYQESVATLSRMVDENHSREEGEREGPRRPPIDAP